MSGWVSKRDVTRQRGVEAPKKKLPGKGRDGVEGVNSGTPTRAVQRCASQLRRAMEQGSNDGNASVTRRTRKPGTTQSKDVRPGFERKSNLRDVGV